MEETNGRAMKLEVDIDEALSMGHDEFIKWAESRLEEIRKLRCKMDVAEQRTDNNDPEES